jgi:hypothetical protein
MRIILLFAICSLSFTSVAQGQALNFGTVYTSEKMSGGDWSDLKKTNHRMTFRQATPQVYTIEMQLGGNETYGISLAYETQTSEDRAYHYVQEGPLPLYWPSTTGATTVFGVLTHKPLPEIYADGELPFDIELEYNDGSRLRFYFSQ